MGPAGVAADVFPDEPGGLGAAWDEEGSVSYLRTQGEWQAEGGAAGSGGAVSPPASVSSLMSVRAGGYEDKRDTRGPVSPAANLDNTEPELEWAGRAGNRPLGLILASLRRRAAASSKAAAAARAGAGEDMPQPPYRVCLVGPPCSGVSRQAQMLAAGLGLTLIRAGDVVREAVEEYQRAVDEREAAVAAAQEEAEAAGEEAAEVAGLELTAKGLLGERAQREAAAEGRVSDGTVAALLAAVVRDGEYGDDGGYVIDGFPVTAAQVYLF